MPALTIPPSGLTLHGADVSNADARNPAILLRINDSILREIKQASRSKDGLHFVTGKVPKLRFGPRSIDLGLVPQTSRDELYAFSAAEGEGHALQFTNLINYRAELRGEEKARADTAGADAALAALQNSLASYAEEKKAQAANISDSILPTPKNRFEAARAGKKGGGRGLLGAQKGSESPSSAVGTPRQGPAPTSAPSTDSALRTKAMRIPALHLLAMGPLSFEDIHRKTRIPKDDLEGILQRVGKQVEGKWRLLDRSFKDLDIWKFEYSSGADRQAAVDNAVRAYDRLRLGKDEKLWQMLLPKEKRGKGTVLSKLHLGAAQANRAPTPGDASPLPDHDTTVESRAASTVNTPRLGPSSTPRPQSGKGGDIMKRLLSKDPKKARAALDAKGKKRKDREDGMSDREGGKPAKRQAVSAKASSKVKSAEIVHSSDEPSSEEEGEVKATPIPPPSPAVQSNTKPKSTSTTANKKKPPSASSPDSSDEPAKPASKLVQKAIARRAAASTPKPTASPAIKPTSKVAQAGKSTPHAASNLSAPSQRQAQRSPQKSDSRPPVPSPLGAARPRVASDVSDRGAVGVQKSRAGAETPKGLGITNGVRKRHDTSASSDSAISISVSADGKRSHDASQKSHVNGVSKTLKTNDHKDISFSSKESLKRKAESTPDHKAATSSKHQKTSSMSSHSQRSLSGSTATASSTAQTSPGGEFPDSSDSNASVADTITYIQGVRLAKDFRDKFYPRYARMYDEQAAKEAKGESISREERETLWAMHRRLEQMKREIYIASERQGRAD